MTDSTAPPAALAAPVPARATTAIALGFATACARILRRPTALSVLLGVALAITSAVIERRAGSAGAVDRALNGTFRLVIPLVVFGIVGEAAGRARLRDAVWPIARYGLARREAALGLIAAAVVASAGVAAVLAAGTVLVAHAPGNLPIARDLWQSAWIGALAAGAYASWFSLGATFWKHGRGRWVILLADFLAGGSVGIAGAILPRGHVQNLLGGAAPMHLAQPASSAVLLASMGAAALLAMLRTRE